MYAFKRETERGFTIHRVEHVKMGRVRFKGLKLGVMWPQAKECWKSPNDKRGKKQILL